MKKRRRDEADRGVWGGMDWNSIPCACDGT